MTGWASHYSGNDVMGSLLTVRCCRENGLASSKRERTTSYTIAPMHVATCPDDDEVWECLQAPRGNGPDEGVLIGLIRLCCGVVWCGVVCCTVLCCVVPCCAVLCCAVLCCAVLYRAMCCALCCAFENIELTLFSSPPSFAPLDNGPDEGQVTEVEIMPILERELPANGVWPKCTCVILMVYNGL